MSLRSRVVASVLGVLLCVATADVRGEPLPAKGKIIGPAQGGFLMAVGDNEKWQVKIDPKAEVHVKGTAEAEFLQPGVMVTFFAEVDRKGMVQGEIAAITVTTENIVRPAFKNQDAAAGDEKGKKKELPETGQYQVAGVIKSNKNGQISVAAPGMLVKGQLSSSVTIDVDAGTFAWVRPGDAVEVKGDATKKGAGVARSVEITLANPLTGGKKKPGRPGKTTEPAKKTDPFAEAAADSEKTAPKKTDAKTDTKTEPAEEGDTAEKTEATKTPAKTPAKSPAKKTAKTADASGE